MCSLHQPRSSMWRCLEDLLVMAPGLKHRFSRVECEKGQAFADRYCSGNDDDDDDDDNDAGDDDEEQEDEMMRVRKKKKKKKKMMMMMMITMMDDDATALFSCRTQLLVYQLSRIYRS